jgi:SAM-dependent methyltransferase
LSEWGFERGTPIDRWYIERFLDDHRTVVGGRLLEVKEDLYGSRYGAARVDTVDIDVDNPRATLHGDLCAPGTLPDNCFDAAIVTQTLQLVADPAAALRQLRAAVKPHGALLLSVPSISRLAGAGDRWRWTPVGFRELLAGQGLHGEVRGYGNLLTARAFLLGMAAEDLRVRDLCHVDENYPLIVTAAITR